MDSKMDGASVDRRQFLKFAGVSVPAAAVAAATGASAGVPAADHEGGGLQDTAHVRAYYESARF